MIWIKFDRTRLITPALMVSFILIWHFYVTPVRHVEVHHPAALGGMGRLVDLLTTPSTLRHTWATLYETMLGFVVRDHYRRGAGHGRLARLLGLSARSIPSLCATQVVPKVALVPLFILWFGFGPESKVVVAAVLAFFPILTNTGARD